jgi:hypothetical protein
VRTLAEIYDQLDKVQVGRIQQLAGKIFKASQLNLTVVGRLTKEEHLVKLLG